jgi:transposase-like protein
MSRSKRARVFSNESKQRMVQRVACGERVATVAEEAGVRPKLVCDWWAAYRTMGVAGLSRKRGAEAGVEAERGIGGRDVVRAVVLFGRRPVRAQARRAARQSRGAHRRA